MLAFLTRFNGSETRIIGGLLRLLYNKLVISHHHFFDRTNFQLGQCPLALISILSREFYGRLSVIKFKLYDKTLRGL
jgi:hypothetical protein